MFNRYKVSVLQDGDVSRDLSYNKVNTFNTTELCT